MIPAVRAPSEERIATRDGASARLERSGESESLTVRDRMGRLMFQYDAATGQGTLIMPEGDLRLCAPRGGIELHAAHGIRATAGGALSLTSAVGIELEARASRGHPAPQGPERSGTMHLSPEQVAIAGDTLRVDAGQSELHLGETHAWAGTLRAAVDRAELGFGQVVRRAERVIDHAENVYQRVTELCELKAGRLRTLVNDSAWLKAGELTLLAKHDVRVDGEHINLG